MRELTDMELKAVSGGWGRRKKPSVDVDIDIRDVDVDVDNHNYTSLSGKYVIGNQVINANNTPVIIGNFFS